MKKSSLAMVSLVLVSTALSSQAALFQFDLSPPGTDAAVGLSPRNEVPAVTNSSGSGNTVSGGITLNTDSNVLHLAVGYGSAAGFTNLTGVATAMHIHSPAPQGRATNVLVDLMPFNFPAAVPTNGGTIMGDIHYPTNAVSDLLAGLAYLNIHTVLNPGGEIRGQLIPRVVTNSPPTVSCPPESTLECGGPASLTVIVSDPDGDALTVVWTANGAVLQTNTMAATSPPAAANVSFLGPLPLGTNAVTVTVTDSGGNSASCSTIVRVVDTTPPAIHSVSATPNSLWPPNHKLITVRLRADVSDTCSAATWKIIGVQSSEAADAKGSGHTSSDWKISGDHSVSLRAERSGKSSGRLYTITIQAKDTSGNLSTPATVTVSVPHDKGKKK